MTPTGLAALARCAALCLLLASCQPSPLAGAARQQRSAEAELLARYPDIAERRQGILRLWPRAYPVSLEDRPCDHHASDCVIHTLDAVFAEGRILGVGEVYYEGGNYTLYSEHADPIEVGERPVASPDGRHLLSTAWSDGHPPNIGLSLVAVSSPAIRLIRRIPAESLTAYENVRWLGTDCASFTAATVGADGAWGDQPHVTWYLIEDTPEWRLSREPSPACKP